MCDCYDYEDQPVGGAVAFTPETIDRMRSLEPSFAGKPVPAEVWRSSSARPAAASCLPTMRVGEVVGWFMAYNGRQRGRAMAF